jgi:predicted NBD/HSP70 family sugar kinase
VGAELRGRLAASYPVLIDNEGNLAAIAEARPGDPALQDMLVLFGEVGVGGGIIAGGQLLRGHQGYAGEFDHMIVDPGGRRCGCGRVGCWETVGGLRALLDAAADPDDPVRDPALSLDDRLTEINRRADLGDTRTLAALNQVGNWVGMGAAILCNALNPAALVLSGYFAGLGHHLRPAIEEHLRAGVLAPHAGGTRVEFSTLGFTAAVRGGAAVALDQIFDDPTLVAPAEAAAGGAR